MNLRKSLYLPTVMLALMWLVEGAKHIVGPLLFGRATFAPLGIFPRQIDSLPGILTSPFIHVDLDHLIKNSIPFAILAVAIFLFYPRIGNKVFLFVLLMTGLGVWMFARDHRIPHVGASGLVYGLAGFLFFSGLFRRDIQSLVASVLIAFLDVMFYGSATIEGMLPSVAGNVSWESHLIGGIVGGICAYYYRKVPSTNKKKKGAAPPNGPDLDGYRNVESDRYAYRYRG